MSDIFLGGACGNSSWRDRLIPALQEHNITYFNPVVTDWNEEAMEIEEREKENSKFRLYVLSPRTYGYYSIAEAVDDSNKCPEKVIFYIMEEDGATEYSESLLKHLNKVKDIVGSNGGYVAEDFPDIVDYVLENTQPLIA